MNRYGEELYFSGYKNNRLYARLYTAGNTDEWAVALCHGMGTDSREFGEFGNLLAERGINCLEFDYSGHGKSAGKRGLITEESHFHDTVAAVDALAKRGFRKVAVVGHSLGAHAALRVQAASADIWCSALLCPQIRSGGSFSSIQYIFFYLLGHFYRLAGDRFSFKIPSKGLNSATLAYLVSVDNLPLVREVTKPLLVVMARNDRKISTEEVYNRFKAVSKSNVSFEFLQDSGHRVFMSEEREHLADIISTFIKTDVGD